MDVRMMVSVVAALLAFGSAQVLAQPVAPDPARAEAAKKPAAKKNAAKKPAAKDAKKKADPKPATAKKADAKAAPVKKADATPRQAPRVYSTNRSTELRDKDGNVIPTNPDAYDVSSAVGKPAPKK